MNEFEKEFLKKFEKENPKIFEMATFLIYKMNRFNRDLKILINLLIGLIVPIYLLILNFILKK
ncbi:hypothetical protein NRK67_02490 [Fusobacteria bacterium ZRK30]|nr:hypothetical protein NRK67_02490 [Fusobacteria bacterium ZRK30]